MAITAFVIDDSAVARKHLTQLLTEAGIQVLGSAADPLFAMHKLQKHWPDVIVLDIEMPRMDGISFLRKLMAEHPTPVVMCSTQSEEGCLTTMQALSAGAVSVVTKPKFGSSHSAQDDDEGLVAAVKAASKANVRVSAASGKTAVERVTQAVLSKPRFRPRAITESSDRIVAIGSSTGGVQSIEVVLKQLEPSCPGVVIVQHMPPAFTASFAERLNDVCKVEVLEAQDGDRIVNGRVLIAPGGRHMEVRREGGHYAVSIFDGPSVNHHRPSVDVLFRSVAECVGNQAVGVIMTGMGDDGARGLKEMKDAGAYTAAQDQASCVVFGMPAMAIKMGAADDVVPLTEIGFWIQDAVTMPLR